MQSNRLWLWLTAGLLSASAQAQITTIRSGQLEIGINNQLQTLISNPFNRSAPLMTGFHATEYLETKYAAVKDFTLTKKNEQSLTDAAGKGKTYCFTGLSKDQQIEKILIIKTYDNFPNTAYFDVTYVNHTRREIIIRKWVNHQYDLLPSRGTPRFWSFQGSSHSDRRDWIQPVNPGFAEQNYMGMNASDYGGGIPVIDLWRRDAGIAIGHTEKQARTVSLPIDYDKYASSAKINIEYTSPDTLTLAPGDSLHCFETFVTVHRKDCFTPLSNYGKYMETRGITPAPAEPAAFEPIWCAWGYGRDFTLAQILQTLPKVKELGIKWVGMDDGFQQALGDWHTNTQHFPGGDAQMKAFVDSIHALGMKAVIWWAPLAVSPGSQFLKEHPSTLLVRQDGSPGYITWWNSFYLAPTDSLVLADMKQTVKLFLQDWGFDALKLDGQHLNACAPDYGDKHNISTPGQSFEKMPEFYRQLFETARSIKPNAVVEFCPCGDCMNFYHMPYTNQFVASDPLNSWQVRLKGKVYKALMPGTAYFGDHVELTDGKSDFASQLGVGAVPGTKFTWPQTGLKEPDESYLTPEKQALFARYLRLYQDKMLSLGHYRGDLYDIGYDLPEAHCIEKDGKMYYAFYASSFSGKLELRGLQSGTTYSVTDYYNNKSLGQINGPSAKLEVSFKGFLLLEADRSSNHK